MVRVKYLHTGEVAERLGVSRRAVERWLEAGRIAGHRTPGGDKRGGHWRVHPRVVDELLARGGLAERGGENE